MVTFIFLRFVVRAKTCNLLDTIYHILKIRGRYDKKKSKEKQSVQKYIYLLNLNISVLLKISRTKLTEYYKRDR